MGLMKTNNQLNYAMHRVQHQPSITKVIPCGLGLIGPEVREQLQTECPSETGLELYAGSDYAIFICSFSQRARHMNSGNFQKQRINLHALELAL